MWRGAAVHIHLKCALRGHLENPASYSGFSRSIATSIKVLLPRRACWERPVLCVFRVARQAKQGRVQHLLLLFEERTLLAGVADEARCFFFRIGVGAGEGDA